MTDDIKFSVDMMKPSVDFSVFHDNYNVETLKSILYKNKDILNERDEKSGWTLLFNAVVNNEFENAEYLLKSGADPNIPNIYGETPLYQAVDIGSHKLINLLLEQGANPNLQQQDGDTPLHIAAIKGDFKVVKLLLLYKADPTLSTFEHNKTAYDYAQERGQVKVLEILTQKLESMGYFDHNPLQENLDIQNSLDHNDNNNFNNEQNSIIVNNQGYNMMEFSLKPNKNQFQQQLMQQNNNIGNKNNNDLVNMSVNYSNINYNNLKTDNNEEIIQNKLNFSSIGPIENKNLNNSVFIDEKKKDNNFLQQMSHFEEKLSRLKKEMEQHGSLTDKKSESIKKTVGDLPFGSLYISNTSYNCPETESKKDADTSNLNNSYIYRRYSGNNVKAPLSTNVNSDNNTNLNISEDLTSPQTNHNTNRHDRNAKSFNMNNLQNVSTRGEVIPNSILRTNEQPIFSPIRQLDNNLTPTKLNSNMINESMNFDNNFNNQLFTPVNNKLNYSQMNNNNFYNDFYNNENDMNLNMNNHSFIEHGHQGNQGPYQYTKGNPIFQNYNQNQFQRDQRRPNHNINNSMQVNNNKGNYFNQGNQKTQNNINFPNKNNIQGDNYMQNQYQYPQQMNNMNNYNNYNNNNYNNNNTNINQGGNNINYKYNYNPINTNTTTNNNVNNFNNQNSNGKNININSSMSSMNQFNPNQSRGNFHQPSNSRQTNKINNNSIMSQQGLSRLGNREEDTIGAEMSRITVKNNNTLQDSTLDYNFPLQQTGPFQKISSDNLSNYDDPIGIQVQNSKTVVLTIRTDFQRNNSFTLKPKGRFAEYFYDDSQDLARFCSELNDVDMNRKSPNRKVVSQSISYKEEIEEEQTFNNNFFSQTSKSIREDLKNNKNTEIQESLISQFTYQRNNEIDNTSIELDYKQNPGHKEIYDFLNDISLPQYIGNFVNNGFDDLHCMIEQMGKNSKDPITDKNLEEIGILMAGHRARILIKLEEMAKNFDFDLPAGTYYNLSPEFACSSEAMYDARVKYVENWLSQLKMNNYTQNWLKAGYYSLELLLVQMASKNPITDKMLEKDFKIDKIGYRVRLLNKLKQGKLVYTLLFIFKLDSKAYMDKLREPKMNDKKGGTSTSIDFSCKCNIF